MLSADDIRAITACLDQIRKIIEGAQARALAEQQTAATTGYPPSRLTRQR